MRKKPHKDTNVSAVGRDSECLERAESVEDATARVASYIHVCEREVIALKYDYSSEESGRKGRARSGIREALANTTHEHGEIFCEE